MRTTKIPFGRMDDFPMLLVLNILSVYILLIFTEKLTQFGGSIVYILMQKRVSMKKMP